MQPRSSDFPRHPVTGWATAEAIADFKGVLVVLAEQQPSVGPPAIELRPQVPGPGRRRRRHPEQAHLRRHHPEDDPVHCGPDLEDGGGRPGGSSTRAGCERLKKAPHGAFFPLLTRLDRVDAPGI